VVIEQQRKRLAPWATPNHNWCARRGDRLDLQSMGAHQSRHPIGGGHKLLGLAGAARYANKLIQHAQKLVG
jgi:hypothetical protein